MVDKKLSEFPDIALGSVSKVVVLDDSTKNGNVPGPALFARTECVNSIAQDINLTLSSGTLTLKSGSVITAPDGTQLSTTTDRTVTASGSATYKAMIFPAKSNGALQSPVNVTQIGSGSSLPADGSVYVRYFNTTDSKIYRYTSGAWSEWSVALPVAIVTVTSGTISNIDIVFNGNGYIGKSFFLLPGLNGFAPNGRYADGTLKYYSITTSALTFYNLAGNNETDSYLVRAQSGGVGKGPWTESETIATGGRTYVPSKNRVYTSSSSEQSCFRFCKYTTVGGVVTKFEIIQPFAAASKYDLESKQEVLTFDSVPTENSTNPVTSGGVYAYHSHSYSNCITSIPQDIKLELSNGTLTLKSGSKVYMPNGTLLQTTTDLSFTPSAVQNQQVFISLTSSGATLTNCKVSNTVSGSTDSLSGTSYHMWYDTTNNVINYYTSGGALGGIRTLPIAIVTMSGNEVTSIDQVFNGAGYVGHHAFILPGLSFVRGNGFNEDGTLASGAFVRNSLTFMEMDTTNRAIVVQNQAGINRVTGWKEVATYDDLNPNDSAIQYVYDKNMAYKYSSGSFVAYQRALVIRYYYNGTTVTQFDVEKPIRFDDKPSVYRNNTFSGYNTFIGGAYLSDTSSTPTADPSDSSARIANTEFVKKAIESSATEPRDVTILWGDGTATVPQSSFELSEAFTNFEQIGFEFCQSSGYYRTMNIMSTYWLNFLLNQSTSSLPISFGYGPGEFLLSLRPYADTTSPSTTTNLSIYNQNVSSIYIFGINRKTIA